MKKTMCDTCGSDKAKTYKYAKGAQSFTTDLCMDCVQDFVLKNQTRLYEATDSAAPTFTKGVIHG